MRQQSKKAEMSAPIFRRYIYLDFDGVLSHESVYIHPKRGIYIREPGFLLFQWMPILEDLLTPHLEIGIVLSTTWVSRKSFSFAKKQLSPALQARVVGSTFHNRETDKALFAQQTRAAQIFADVSRRGLRIEDWIAIDDDAESWPLIHARNLIRTDGATGISTSEVQAAIEVWLDKPVKE